jgi:two-component system OmpR family sensor kinase/two-component system sensor histidine kinase BaeS
MRIRLILSFVLIVLVAVLLVVFLARQNAATEVRAFMYRGGMSGTDGLVSSLADYYRQRGSWKGVESLLVMPGHSYGRGPGGQSSGMGQGMMMGQRLRLADAQGEMVFDSGDANSTGSLSGAEMRNAIPVELSGRTVGYLLAEGGMGYNRAAETFLLNRLTTAALTAGLIAAGLSMLLALFLAYQLMRPVREMTQAARRLGEGDLAQRVRVSGNDELAILGRTFNSMASSLQQAAESRRALTADIAHELRTPLAVQRAHLEALQDGVYPLVVDNLAPIAEQNLLLTRLVDDLRTLALADAGQLALERLPTDMLALAVRVVERFQPHARARQIDLTLAANGERLADITWTVDAQRIEQILGNLLSNALRHTPQGGQIQVDLLVSAGAVRVSVQDSGPGIPQEALPHVFERFYRADRARSRAEGGSGLGLAIARHLAEAHGGTLTAANHPLGGAVFTLTLPGG